VSEQVTRQGRLSDRSVHPVNAGYDVIRVLG
jgi:hypothetical protein